MNEDWSTSSYSAHNGNCVQARFRKSSHSNSNGCVEVGWRKASASASNGHCTEVRMASRTVQVRDSKDPSGPVLTFTRDAWEAFTAGIRAGA